MAHIIDLAAFQPEPLEIKLPNGEVYIVPATLSVSYMTKLMAVQERMQKLKSPTEQLVLLQEMAVLILSLDKSKTVTLEKVKEDLDNVSLLSALTKLFHEHINGKAEQIVHKDEESPNTKTPAEK